MECKVLFEVEASLPVRTAEMAFVETAKLAAVHTAV
jgi:hypothetical protein